MNRKLLLLDVLLAVGVIYGGFQLRSQWSAAKARQAQMPGPAMKPAPPPPMSPLPSEPAVLPSAYKEVATKTLFDPSRNPDVPVEVVAPPPPPPDPVPPPLPSFHGSMDIGEGPVALMTLDGETRYQEVHLGGMIGQFKLMAFNRQEIELEWHGKTIHSRRDERKAERAGGRGKSAPVAPQFVPGLIPGQAVEQPLAPPPSNAPNELGPGDALTDTVKGCQPGDTTAPGTIVGGYRKEQNASPLGVSQCLWRAVGK